MSIHKNVGDFLADPHAQTVLHETGWAIVAMTAIVVVVLYVATRW